MKKNRWHEKNLAEHGPLEWKFVSGAGWDSGLFDDLAAIERSSWDYRTLGQRPVSAAGHGAALAPECARPTPA